jgi:hypothetical protein
VVLGNLDCHNWSKANTAAPVLSQLELCILTSLAIHHKRIIKNCNVKQAFFNHLFLMMKFTLLDLQLAVLVRIQVLFGIFVVPCMGCIMLLNFGSQNCVLHYKLCDLRLLQLHLVYFMAL